MSWYNNFSLAIRIDKRVSRYNIFEQLIEWSYYVNKKDINNQLLQILDENELLTDEPMKLHTSFKIGGPADFYVIPGDIEKLKKTVEICNEYNIPNFIIGNGSNLLVTDKGYRGVIIQIGKNLSNVHINDEIVFAEAGILLSKLARAVYESSLTGFEFASGIPGTLGGAVFMNAGAYGGEIKDIIINAEVMDNKGNIFTLNNDELKLTYRSSILQKKEYIVLSALLKLKKGNKETIKSVMDDLTDRRKTKQPLEYPSAGSTFKRPEGYYAGKLIMDADLRGYSIGDAQVSEKHCGFIVNKGLATFEDVFNLINHVREAVNEKFSVDLEPEVRILGEPFNK